MKPASWVSVLIRACAQEYNLDAISSPYKKFYQNKWNDTYVVAPLIQAYDSRFTLEQIQQLYTIIKKTGFADAHKDNIFNTREGIIYIIDTEENPSFCPHKSWPLEEFVSALDELRFLPKEPNATDWIEAKSEKYRKQLCAKHNLPF